MALAVSGCGPGSRSEPDAAAFVVEVRGAGLDLRELTWEPEDAVTRVERAPDRVELGLAQPRALTLVHPASCPLDEVTPTATRPRAIVELRPWIEVDPEIPQAGFDTVVTVAARPGCRDALRGTIAWRAAGGAGLRDFRIEQNGWRVRGKTLRFEDAWRSAGRPPPDGIVPFSTSTRGESVLEATWSRGATKLVRQVRIAAASRASGLPSVGYGHEVVLGGGPWAVKTRPPNGRADVRAIPETALSTFLPDLPGRWELTDGAGGELSVRVGRHDDTPLDCGRAECHQSASRHAVTTPMASALARNLASCTLPCHAVGEPGLPDGGFVHLLE